MHLPSLPSLVLALATALSVAAPSAMAQAPAAPAAQPIRLGLILPLTGGSSDMGNSARVGAQVAVDEINAVGGYLGRKLELVIRDDQANNDQGLAHAEELVLKEKVTATIGFCNTGVAQKSLDTFQNAQLPLIIPCATEVPGGRQLHLPHLGARPAAVAVPGGRHRQARPQEGGPAGGLHRLR